MEKNRKADATNIQIQEDIPKKRILLFSPTGGHAGIDVCLENIVTNIDRSRFEVYVVLPKNAYLKKQFMDLGVHCYELPLLWWFPVGFTGSDLLQIASTMRPNIDALRRIIRKEKIEVVLSNTIVSLDACIASLLCCVPHLFYMHARFVDNIYAYMSPVTKHFLYQFMSKASAYIVCCSRKLCEQMSNEIDNVIYVNNGINEENFSFMQKSSGADGEKKLNMICVGHFNQNKQQDFVLRALRELKQKNREALEKVHFTAIGPAEEAYLAELKRLVCEYRIEDYVTFEGFEPNVPKRLRQYNVYINSSITETLPLSVMEAMASGLPALVTPTDGGEMIVRDGMDGFVCKTPRDMAEKMEQLLEEDQLLSEMSRNARTRIEQEFSLRQYISRFEEVLDQTTRESYSVDENLFRQVQQLYEIVTVDVRNKRGRISVLVVYPDQAIATYVLAAEKPLRYLEEKGEVFFKGVLLQNMRQEDIDQADIVYCIRFFHDEAHKLLKQVKSQGKAFVWYIDDNYSTKGVGEEENPEKKKFAKLYDGMFEDSDYVVVNNQVIYEHGRDLTDNISCLPTYQVISHHKFKTNKREDVIRFGFMGTLGRDGDFECVEKALLEVLNKHPEVELEFIGYHPAGLEEHPQVKCFDFMFDYDQFRDFFESREWDFAIAPLSDTEFNRSKTNNKYREYSSFGIPAVFSNISTYQKCVKNGVNGLLTNNTEEAWTETIEQMLCKPEKRRYLAQNALNDIRENYGIDRFAEPLLEIFADMMQRKAVSVMESGVKDETGIATMEKELTVDWNVEVAPKRRLMSQLMKTEAKTGLQQMNPAAWAMMRAFIPDVAKKHIRLSDLIPYQTYVEYQLSGIGNLIQFVLVGECNMRCIVEIVQNGRIVYNGCVNVNSWMLHSIRIGNLRGENILVRFKATGPADIVRTVEYVKPCGIWGTCELCAWID